MGDEPAVEVQEALEAPERGSADELLDAGAHAPIDAMRHSAAHVMAEAVLDLFPGAKLGIGPAIDNGFYYDFDLPRSLTPEDLAAVEARMAASVAAAHPFVRTELSFDDARAAAAGAGQTYKVEILDDLAARAREAGEPLPVTTFYEHGPFSDLCKGPHVETTADLGPFKLLSVAGAYWRGDEKRPMLQRIYGTVWETQEELDQFLWRREEAKKRDHRKLGVRLDLFSFHDVSPGRRLLASEGLAPLPDAARCDARAPGAARLRGGLHTAARPPEAVGAVRPLGALPGQHVPRRGRGPDLQPQADELPRVDLHLPQPPALLPGPAPAAVGIRRPPPQRAVGGSLRV